MEEGTLYSALKKKKNFKQADASRKLRDVLDGVYYLHNQNIALFDAVFLTSTSNRVLPVNRVGKILNRNGTDRPIERGIGKRKDWITVQIVDQVLIELRVIAELFLIHAQANHLTRV